MNPGMETPSGRDTLEAPRRSPLWGLASIFFSPSETFAASRERRAWLVPVLAASMMGLILNIMVINVIGLETITRNELESRPQLAERLGQERLDEMARDAGASSTRKWISYASAAFMIPIGLCIVSGIILGGLLITGGSVDFRSVLTAAAWGAYASLTIQVLATAAFLSAVRDFSGVEVSNLIALNLSIFLDRSSTSPALYSIASSVDLLSFYNMFLMSLGISKLSAGMSFARAFSVVLALWALYVLARAGFASLF